MHQNSFASCAVYNPRSTPGCSCEAAIISNSVRLIVVDGMSALCRKENLHRYSGAAEKAFTGVAAVLKRQAAELGCAVIMTNIEEAAESNESIASTAVSADCRLLRV